MDYKEIHAGDRDYRFYLCVKGFFNPGFRVLRHGDKARVQVLFVRFVYQFSLGLSLECWEYG